MAAKKKKAKKPEYTKPTEPQYLYDLWKRIRGITGNPNHPKYKDYGGRGIGMYEPWRPKFPPFRTWILENLGERPTPQHSLDRINVNKGYTPKNIQWATLIQQARNQRSNRIVTLGGEKKCLTEWCEEYGRDVKLVWMRIFQLGWKPRKALETPPRKLTRQQKAAMLLIRVANMSNAEDSAEFTLECLCADDFGASRVPRSKRTEQQRKQVADYKATLSRHEALERAAKTAGLSCSVTQSPDRNSEHSDAYIYFKLSQLELVEKLLKDIGLEGDILDVPAEFPNERLEATFGHTNWKVERR